jgi:hypothetical protein
MEDRDELLADVRYRLEQAQAVAKRNYDEKHQAITFAPGEWVWLRVRHRTPLSLPIVTTGKLKPHYYGPYQISELVKGLFASVGFNPAGIIDISRNL